MVRLVINHGEAMKITKQIKQAVFDKSAGHCWYCGADLHGSKWHADHLKPVIRIRGGMINPENDTVENLVPACHACNLHKHSNDLENYRRIITEGREQFIRSGKGKALLRMGLASVSDAPVKFWFEQQDL